MDDDFQSLHPTFENLFQDPKMQPSEGLKLLDLPIELIIIIVELVVQKPFNIDPGREGLIKNPRTIFRPPPICHACRLLREKGLPAFYRLNDFEYIGSDPRRNAFSLQDWIEFIWGS